jgi:hypothetical protein
MADPNEFSKARARSPLGSALWPCPPVNKSTYGLDGADHRHAQAINLYCDPSSGTGYEVREGRRLWPCHSPTGDHDIGRYFDALRSLVAQANDDAELLVARD